MKQNLDSRGIAAFSLPVLLAAILLVLGVAPQIEAPLQLTGAPSQTPFDPPAVYLSWQQDPATTMTIHWHSIGEGYEPRIEYQLTGAADWSEARGRSHPMPGSDREIHIVQLTELQPAASYSFRWSVDSKTYRFRTMPAELQEPIRFVVGGDTRHTQELMEEMNRQALRFDPEFVALGGDLAYADGREDRVYRWYEWFDAYKRTLITSEGRIIPVLAAIGNHEVRGGYFRNHEGFAFTGESRRDIAPYFYSLFAFPGERGYGVLDFGKYMSFIFLDSDHTNPVGGEQTAWLEKTLRERQEIPHRFALYHVTSHPSHRSFDGRVETLIRQHWVPAFERFDMELVFENHDHTYKRTHPIREGRIDSTGVIYMGDGAWGVQPRTVHPPAETWYLARAESRRNLLLVTLYPDQRHVLAIDNEGFVFDELYQLTRTPVE